MSKINISNAQIERIKNAMKVIDEEIVKFIRNIFNDICVNSDIDKYYIKTDFSNMCYNIYIYNTETNQIIGKSYDLISFLEKCYNRKIEFELNKDIKEMYLKAQEQYTEEIKWI